MIKIAALADLHGNLPLVPPCDVAVISGDICPHKGVREVVRYGIKTFERVRVGSDEDIFYQSQWLQGPFNDWLNDIPAKEVVATLGNHDFIGEKRPELIPKNLRWHLLMDQSWEYERVKFFGSPWSGLFFQWAFNAPGPGGSEEGEQFMGRKWANIPDDTDVIIIHGPPFGYGDMTDDGIKTGSHTLTERMKQIKPKLLICGHIHSGRGIYPFERGNMEDGRVINAAILNERYEMVHSPIVTDI